MSRYAVAHLDEIDEMDDGRCPWRPVRHHLGITAFGINAWTGREAGEYAQAADRGRALVKAHPQYAALFYNVACCESLAGRPAEAIDHLRRAIEISERLREYASDDSDFDPIRNDSAFKDLVGGER